MEDYILREIDRIGEMLQHIARRLGLLNDNPPAGESCLVSCGSGEVE